MAPIFLRAAHFHWSEVRALHFQPKNVLKSLQYDKEVSYARKKTY